MKPHTNLLEQLTIYSNSDFYPFHMPGHKRHRFDFPNPWSIDITEIDGFDNLHHATGILQELEKKAASLFGAKRSFCLVNGSTCGILTAISACVKPGEKILMARNCHKSAYHGVYLRNITPVYVMPELTPHGILGSISPKTIEIALKQHDVKAVLIVSPTYDGILSNVEKIAEIVHAHGIPLIVDEAHGAHLSFTHHFPKSALSCHADLVIQSLHKTLPAFTQTALLHLNSDFVEERLLRRFLSIYQSSSPSYLFLASISQCLTIVENQGPALLRTLRKNLEDFYEKCQGFSTIQVLSNLKTETSSVFDYDDSKILISGENTKISGEEIQNFLLQEHKIQLEMAAGNYALALSSLMDTRQGFQRLFQGLFDLEKKLLLRQKTKSTDNINNNNLNHKNTTGKIYQIPQQKMVPASALELPYKKILLEDSVNCVSGEYLYLYPPGIPLLAPGEVINPELLQNLLWLKTSGFSLQGLLDTTNTWINIVKS